MNKRKKIMKITNKEEDKKSIIDAIADAEGKSTERTITFEKIQDSIQCLENILKHRLFLPKKDWSGLNFRVGCAADVTSSYKWKPLSTIVTIEFKSGSWRILNLTRDRLYHDIEPINIKEDRFVKKIQERIPLIAGIPSTWAC